MRLCLWANVLACAGIGASVARADLVIDLRTPSPCEKWPILSHSSIGTRIPIDVFAVVTGSVGPNAAEGLQSVQGAFITDRVSIRGRLLPAGDLDAAEETTVLPARSPFNNLGATPGDRKSIPAPRFGLTDSVTDLGDVPARNDLGSLVVFRADNMQLSGGAIPIPNGREYHIGRIELEVFDLGDGGSIGTLNWYFRTHPNGEAADEAVLFRQDGVDYSGLTGTYRAGAPILLGGYCPEPTAVSVFAVAAVAFAKRRARLRPTHGGEGE
jgi:hypothetical protein